MHPVLFEVIGLPISPYGLLIALGMLTGIWVAKRRGRAIGIPEEAVYDTVFWGVLLGFVGARIAFVLVNFGAFLRDPLPLVFSREGFVFLGGFLAALPVIAVVLRRWRVRYLAMADLLAPSLALAHAFGRMGCFFAGCCYGGVCDRPWAVRFPRIIDWRRGPVDLAEAEFTPGGAIYHGVDRVGDVVGSPAFYDQVKHGQLDWSDTASLAVHPVQLYDVAIQLGLFALLSWMWWRRRTLHGQIFLLYLWLYAASRIVLELFRGDLERGLWFGGWVSTSQLISGGLIVVALGLTLQRRRLFAPASEPAAAPRDPGDA
ncbi:MAG: prolipoprotein diacylglyceryl transferase [Candidatus Sumerlaeia bacterium]|nr:prolipoprotein diacylglyceryl transferase [Candidatus Sumerlaeia bacterium]